MLQTFSRLLPYALRQWQALVLILALTIASSGVAVLQPLPLKLLVDYALERHDLPEGVARMLSQIAIEPTPAAIVSLACVMALGCFLLDSALQAGLSWAWTIAGQRMVYELAGHLFSRLQRLSLLFHSRRSLGDSLDRLATDTWCVYAITEGLIVSPLQQLLTLAAIGAAAWTLDWQLTLVALTAVPLLTAIARWLGPHLKRLARRQRESQSKLMSFVHQTLTAIPLVQVFDVGARNRCYFNELAAETIKESQRGALINNAYTFLNGLTNTCGVALVLFYGGQRVLSGSLSLGSLLVLLAYLKTMQRASEKLFQTYGKLKGAEASVERVVEVLDTEDLVPEPAQPKPLPALPLGRRGHICLEDVTVGYEPGRAVIHQLSLDARPGEIVALVGATGAGKSTLVSLILRFLDPWQGCVRFDGLDLREVSLADLRAQVALVLQEPFLLPLTIAENIAYGRPASTAMQIDTAAKAASADEFIRNLPQGYNTVIGERGVTLSGGEKQRLAIARAMLKDAAVVVLDEPTSALDSTTESSVLAALDRLLEGRTTFIIAHRLTTIRRATRVIVLDGGRIVESGTPRQLLDEGTVYKRLHALQFSGNATETMP